MAHLTNFVWLEALRWVPFLTLLISNNPLWTSNVIHGPTFHHLNPSFSSVFIPYLLPPATRCLLLPSLPAHGAACPLQVLPQRVQPTIHPAPRTKPVPPGLLVGHIARAVASLPCPPPTWLELSLAHHSSSCHPIHVCPAPPKRPHISRD